MDIYSHFNKAQKVAEDLSDNDWNKNIFNWQKAYIATVLAALAYEKIPPFELEKSKRAKIIPCGNYQANFSRWEIGVPLNEPDLKIDFVVRTRVVVAIAHLSKAIFISLRGTTLSFADFKADLDI